MAVGQSSVRVIGCEQGTLPLSINRISSDLIIGLKLYVIIDVYYSIIQ